MGGLLLKQTRNLWPPPHTLMNISYTLAHVQIYFLQRMQLSRDVKDLE